MPHFPYQATMAIMMDEFDRGRELVKKLYKAEALKLARAMVR